MPVISDTLTAGQRAYLDALPTKRETHEKREALIFRDGQLDWRGEKCAPCSRCGRVFVAASLRTFYGPGATALVCRRCKGEPCA